MFHKNNIERERIPTEKGHVHSFALDAAGSIKTPF